MAQPLQRYPFTPFPDDAVSEQGWRLASGQHAEALSGADQIIGGSSSDLSRGSGLVIAGELLSQAGADRITGIASAQSSQFSYGLMIQGGSLDTGSGDDTVLGSGFAGLFAQSAAIKLGRGNDRLSGVGQGQDGLTYGLNLNDGTQLHAGDGDDRVRGRSKAGEAGFGILNSGVLLTQAGNDVITACSTNLIGLENTGRIKTGSGDDRISAEGVRAAILNDGSIDTGNGADRMDAMAGGFAGAGFVDLGRGNDHLSGFGSGYFDGAAGIDTLRLPSGSYRITGSSDRVQLSAVGAGADAVVMVVTGFERFAAGASARSINAALESGVVEFA